MVTEPLKVGRSVDRRKIAQDNLIFDCRVLSRNHALISFENGKVSVYHIVTLRVIDVGGSRYQRWGCIQRMRGWRECRGVIIGSGEAWGVAVGVGYGYYRMM